MRAQARWFAALVSSCLAVLTSSVAAQLTVRLDQGRLVWRAGETALGAKAEGVWRANFGREEADTHRASCWSPTLGSFHTPARFGEMGF